MSTTTTKKSGKKLSTKSKAKAKASSKPSAKKPKVEKKSTKKSTAKIYRKGTLKKNIFEYLERIGFGTKKFKYENDAETFYNESEKIAKSIKPNTKYNKGHLSWYKNRYLVEKEEAVKKAKK